MGRDRRHDTPKVAVVSSSAVAVFSNSTLTHIVIATLLALPISNFAYGAKDRSAGPSQVMVHAVRESCAVDVDGDAAGKTDANGNLVADVEPSDHYVHVNCPTQPESTFFISPRPGASLELHADGENSAADGSPSNSAPMTAEAKLKLRDLIQESVQRRASGHFDDAVERLREAASMDPHNSDLHRELGITFLLMKEWNRARVEMLEAIRHQPDDADAHNGLGYALEKMGRLDAALQEFRIATRLDPDDLSYRQHYIDALSRSMPTPAGKKK